MLSSGFQIKQTEQEKQIWSEIPESFLLLNPQNQLKLYDIELLTVVLVDVSGWGIQNTCMHYIFFTHTVTIVPVTGTALLLMQPNKKIYSIIVSAPVAQLAYLSYCYLALLTLLWDHMTPGKPFVLFFSVKWEKTGVMYVQQVFYPWDKKWTETPFSTMH